MIRKIKQCCGDVCLRNTHCEEDAWKQYQKQRMQIYKQLLSNSVTLFIIGAVVGFVIGKMV